MHPTTQPRVTIAIPLYRSKRFLRIIRHNIHRIDLPHAEILISDRHCDDDTLTLLQQEFGHDNRIRFLAHTDRIGWVDHYNELLRVARGRYFMWMPHDDSFPRHYVPLLLADFEQNPALWLSFGTLYSVYRRPRRVETAGLPNWQVMATWSPWTSLRWLLWWNMGVAMRGIFDRERILAHQLLLKPIAPANRYVDIYWLFAIGLNGPMHYNPAVCTVKRMYADSTSAVWQHSDYFTTRCRRTLRTYLRDANLYGPAQYVFPLILTVYGWTYQITVRTLFRLYPGIRQQILGLLFKKSRS